MNLDRAVISFAGVMVLLSLGLAELHSPYWLLLTAFVGLNLLQAGIAQDSVRPPWPSRSWAFDQAMRSTDCPVGPGQELRRPRLNTAPSGSAVPRRHSQVPPYRAHGVRAEGD